MKSWTPRQVEKNLATLRKRANHLRKRIDAAPAHTLSYDEQEYAALMWAIETLGIKPANDHEDSTKGWSKPSNDHDDSGRL